MAEKTKAIERNYVIPLRKAVIKTASWRRAKKAMAVIRIFMKKHMKSENIKLGKELNELVWERGGKRVPSKISVTAKKEDDVVKVNLVGIETEKVKEKPKKEEKKEKKEEVKEEKKETHAHKHEKNEKEE